MCVSSLRCYYSLDISLRFRLQSTRESDVKCSLDAPLTECLYDGSFRTGGYGNKPDVASEIANLHSHTTLCEVLRRFHEKNQECSDHKPIAPAHKVSSVASYRASSFMPFRILEIHGFAAMNVTMSYVG
jgi:hypothetical protein